jgi:hypothetical protein
MRARLSLFIGVSFSALACGDAMPSVPMSDAVLTYVVLGKDSTLATDSVVSGLVATAGTPTQARYRSVEQFSMTRARDGAAFAWQVRDMAGQPISTRTLDLAVPVAGNISLSRQGRAGQLGRDSLAYGERYSFRILTEGVTVEGDVRIPGQPQPVHITRGTQEILAWPRVPGAAGYAILVDTDRIPQIALGDTEYVVRRDRSPGEIPPTPVAVVRALDSNLVRLITDTSTRSAGVRGAYGVIGAISSGSINLGATPP